PASVLQLGLSCKHSASSSASWICFGGVTPTQPSFGSQLSSVQGFPSSQKIAPLRLLHSPSVQASPVQMFLSLQLLPHEPQWNGDECTSAQVRLQFDRPPSQAFLQVPRSQTWLLGQALPHWPQLAGSPARSTQLLLQLVRPMVQFGAHTP